MEASERYYLELLALGSTPQEARAALSTDVKTELMMTGTLVQWFEFFKLRAVGTSGKPHPQMLEIAVPMLADFKVKFPGVFDDLIVKDAAQ
jgi:thymidylate synthase (FAD)